MSTSEAEEFRGQGTAWATAWAAGGFGAGVWWATAWMAGDRLAGSGLL